MMKILPNYPYRGSPSLVPQSSKRLTQQLHTTVRHLQKVVHQWIQACQVNYRVDDHLARDAGEYVRSHRQFQPGGCVYPTIGTLPSNPCAEKLFAAIALEGGP